MESPAQRRLDVIQSHLLSSSNAEDDSFLRHNLTSSSHFLNGEKYSVLLPEKLQSGKWNVHRSVRSPLKLLSRFDDHPEIGTLHDTFVHASETYTYHKYLGTRIRVDGTVGSELYQYKWMTYGEAAIAREEIGSGLLYYGLKQGACVGLYFINRPEWLIVDHACAAYSYISVPLYDTLGPDAVKYVVNHSAIQAIFCDRQTLNSLLSFISLIPSVHLIVVVGEADDHLPSLPSTNGVKIITYSTLVANVAAFCRVLKFYPSDVYISYLPLAHIYERTDQIICLYSGMAIGFYQGDTLKLMDDLAALRPTIFCSVPRLFNRIYVGITNTVKASGTLKERLFTVAYNSKKQAIMNVKKASLVWDRLVFNKIREKLGGRVRFMASGASPLSPEVMEFLRV
ncbi:Long chain acyl-CoA synthetase 7, peroxisomal [Hibiscus syriacus]|uniref:Long chain acyl-CoA synthetase 7, peroxisomal n=1 Tax=Hibiscus syriacus TaxID=106335 RepID=A0A6A2XUH3_HIBSY|nr:Long chain acyl-CoA synthetase 7, peroxisomal [Hibiscus syriacus]